MRMQWVLTPDEQGQEWVVLTGYVADAGDGETSHEVARRAVRDEHELRRVVRELARAIRLTTPRR